MLRIWEFPRGTLFWCPYSKDPTIQGAILVSPIFGKNSGAFWTLGKVSALLGAGLAAVLLAGDLARLGWNRV